MALTLRLCPGIAEVPKAAWDRLVGDDDPFVEHAFLNALEQSGSVSQRTGWAPCHLLVSDDSGSPGVLVGAAPLYLKSHSYGEYIFDWSWANASERMHRPYYPKLVCAVPFTPATGPRLLVDPTRDAAAIRKVLASGLRAAADATGAASVHVLFCSEVEREALEAAGFMGRMTYQFHWNNADYAHFEDFLGAFRAPDRRKARRERRDAQTLGLELVTRNGTELSDAEWEALYDFYRSTTDEKGAIAYLTPEFFARLRSDLPERLHVNLALQDGRPVAGAIGFRKGKHLLGRYWGALDAFAMLHFELCYYRNIEYAIDHRLERFEAGAQGDHKLKRGLLPSATWSAHWIRDPGLSGLIARSNSREHEAMAAEMAEYAAHSPFRDSGTKSRE